jgi:1,4-alpha-glucan branching enzyme
VISYVRRGDTGEVVVVLNLTPVPRSGYRVGVPRSGVWKETFNSDSRFYGGSDLGNPLPLLSEPVEWMRYPQSVVLTLPPLAGIVLERE